MHQIGYFAFNFSYLLIISIQCQVFTCTSIEFNFKSYSFCLLTFSAILQSSFQKCVRISYNISLLRYGLYIRTLKNIEEIVLLKWF